MLSIEALRVRYGATEAPVVEGLTLDVGDGETVALLGPSGCGKTTVLRAVAGLVPIDGGTVALDGRDLAEVPTHRRGLGLMFQEYALFPHRRVAGNVEFGLRMQGMAPPERRSRVDEVLALVGLAGYADRSVDALSGGERQRVALARALAPAPRLLMLDEPLGALDRTLRDRLVLELAELFAELGVSVLYVTHDQSEALALADRVAVMDRGRIVQVGSPTEVWSRPADAFVARFLGFANVVDVMVGDGVARTEWGLAVVLGGPDAADGPATVVIRPDAITLDRSATGTPGTGAAGGPGGSAGVGVSGGPAGTAGATVSSGMGAPALPVRAVVEGHAFAGDHTVVRLRVPAGHGHAEVHLEAVARGASMPPALGATVELRVEATGVVRLGSPSGPGEPAADLLK